MRGHSSSHYMFLFSENSLTCKHSKYRTVISPPSREPALAKARDRLRAGGNPLTKTVIYGEKKPYFNFMLLYCTLNCFISVCGFPSRIGVRDDPVSSTGQAVFSRE